MLGSDVLEQLFQTFNLFVRASFDTHENSSTAQSRIVNFRSILRYACTNQGPDDAPSGRACSRSRQRRGNWASYHQIDTRQEYRCPDRGNRGEYGAYCARTSRLIPGLY